MTAKEQSQQLVSAHPESQLMNAFQNLQNKSDVAEIIKELFDLSKINVLTELSQDEIRLITRILMISDLKNMPVWEKGVATYMKLMISHKRKSRKEILDAIRGYSKNEDGFFNRMNPFGRRG